MTLSPARQAALEAMQERRRAATDDRIEDLEFLIDVGTPLEDALPRVGWTPNAAAVTLRRRGHPFATPANALSKRRQRTGPADPS